MDGCLWTLTDQELTNASSVNDILSPLLSGCIDPVQITRQIDMAMPPYSQPVVDIAEEGTVVAVKSAIDLGDIAVELRIMSDWIGQQPQEIQIDFTGKLHIDIDGPVNHFSAQ